MNEPLRGVRNVFKIFLDSRTEKQVIGFFGSLSFIIAMITTGWVDSIPSHWITNTAMGLLIVSNVFFATAQKAASSAFLVRAVGFSYICFISQWQLLAMIDQKKGFDPIFPWGTNPVGVFLIIVSVVFFTYYCFWWTDEESN